MIPSSQSSRASRRSPTPWNDKIVELQRVLAEPVVDLWRLRELALSEGGLVNDTIRQRAWPKLVGLHDHGPDEAVTPTTPTRPPPASSSPSARSRRPHDTPPRVPTTTLRPPRPGPVSSTHTPSRPRTVLPDDDSVASAGSRSRYRLPPIVAQSLDGPQIDLDVARCTWHLLTGTQRTQRLQMEHKRHRKVARLIKRKQRRLANLINYALVQSYTQVRVNDPHAEKDPRLRYYQGYHDVACIFLSTLGGSVTANPTTSFSNHHHNRNHNNNDGMELLAASMGLQLPAAVLLQISNSHLRDCLQSNFQTLQTALRLTLMPLLAYFDPDLHAHLFAADMEPFFALSWVITWFAHEIRDTGLVKRLFDVFLVSHALMPVYLSVAMITHQLNREEILHTECDFSLLHQALRGLPKNSSTVGWKYRPGDGYVSDDEADDDEDSVYSENVETEFLLVQSDLELHHRYRHNVPGEAQSSVSSALSCASMESPSLVPFQELIDAAIVLMRRVPPHKLPALATRYYGADVVETMMREDVGFFQPPPQWAVASRAPADWVLQQQQEQQQARTRRGSKSTARRDRRRSQRSRSRSRDGQPTIADAARCDPEDATVSPIDETLLVQTVPRDKINSVAVIAAGLGRGGDDEDTARRRRRKRTLWVAAAVAVAAVAVGVALQYRQQPAPGVAVHESPYVLRSSGEDANAIRPRAEDNTIVTELSRVETIPVPEMMDSNSAQTDHVLVQSIIEDPPFPKGIVAESCFRDLTMEAHDEGNQTCASILPTHIPVWESVRGVTRGIAKLGGRLDKIYQTLVESSTQSQSRSVTYTDPVGKLPSLLGLSAAVQSRATAQISKMGGHLDDLRKNFLDPKARQLALLFRQRTNSELTRLSERFRQRGVSGAVSVHSHPEIPAWLSLQSRTQEHVAQEVLKIGDILHKILEPRLRRSVGTIDSAAVGRMFGESADRIRDVLGSLSPLVERLNKPWEERS
jgi:hypothetical protein